MATISSLLLPAVSISCVELQNLLFWVTQPDKNLHQA